MARFFYFKQIGLVLRIFQYIWLFSLDPLPENIFGGSTMITMKITAQTKLGNNYSHTSHSTFRHDGRLLLGAHIASGELVVDRYPSHVPFTGFRPVLSAAAYVNMKPL